MKTIYVEVHAGEGGEDSKLFVIDLVNAYARYAKLNGLTANLVQVTEGKAILEVAGEAAYGLFYDEAGKHTIQRVPPTETRGRTHTSIVSVAVISPIEDSKVSLNEKDLKIETKRGSGPGGQHRNKTESAVVVTHIPTGLKVKIDSRDQHQNKKLAIKILTGKVQQLKSDSIKEANASTIRNQLGSGSRSNKIRTYNFKESRAVDHRTNKKSSLVQDIIEKGRFDLLK